MTTAACTRLHHNLTRCWPGRCVRALLLRQMARRFRLDWYCYRRFGCRCSACVHLFCKFLTATIFLFLLFFFAVCNAATCYAGHAARTLPSHPAMASFSSSSTYCRHPALPVSLLILHTLLPGSHAHLCRLLSQHRRAATPHHTLPRSTHAHAPSLQRTFSPHAAAGGTTSHHADNISLHAVR